MQGTTVLVVDDVEDERAVMTDALVRSGLAVLEAGSVPEAEKVLAREDVSLVVLDIGLPGTNGLQLLSRLREESLLPVILVTGRSGEVDRVIGLEFGADDYVVKPFTPRELAARVAAVLRRSGTKPVQRTTLSLGPLVLDTLRRSCLLAGQELELRRREFDLLAHLLARPGRAVPRAEILREVWGSENNGSDASLTEHVRRLRAVLGPDAPVRIRTLRGIGYLLEE